ncbi:tetratricopeptide repeat protein [Halomonas sp. Bachu 37]|uniref:tetratricopeptide repeat protein n=1 Tax=Halomonas kashgarensis TaxID=3084920 RepID=UPI003217CB68
MNTASTALHVLGNFDTIHEETAYGWAFSPQQPQQRLAVELIDERGELAGYGIAEHHREDLAPAGIGDGHHQFKLALAYSLYDGEEHSLTAFDANTGQPLQGTHTFGPATRSFAFDLMSREAGQQWLIEHLRQTPNLTRQRAESLLNAYRLSCVLHETHHVEEARNAWHAIAEATGLHGLSHCKQGELHLLQGQHSDALASYQRAVDAAPEHPWPHLGLANALQQLGRYSEAESAVQQALNLAPEASQAQAQASARLHTLQRTGLPERVNALVEQGDSQAATRLLIERLLAHPDEQEAAELLGHLLLPAQEDDEPLPGQDTLHAFQRQERVLNALLDHVDTQLNESPRT